MQRMQRITDFFQPNKNVARSSMLMLVAVQVALALLLWVFSSSPLLPTPMAIGRAFVKLVTQEDLFGELTTSMFLSLEAMIKTIVISLFISYLTVLPFFRPLAFAVSKLRFLTLVGLSFVFVLLTSGGHDLKVWLLTFGITVFFVTSMNEVIRSIRREEFNYGRTLGMNEWQVVWHVVIVGRLPEVFEIIRQNFAMGWLMLTMVEGFSRSDGGIGVMLLNQNKHFQLDAVFAIQFLILAVGIAQDYVIGLIKNLVCPYSKLTLERV